MQHGSWNVKSSAQRTEMGCDINAVQNISGWGKEMLFIRSFISYITCTDSAMHHCSRH